MITAYALVRLDVPGHLALVGSGDPRLVAALRDEASILGIPAAALMLDAEHVLESRYRDYLAAADVAVQLRRAPPGSISGALMDAIAAGLPAVASATLAEAIEPPPYVIPVADDAAPAAIAHAIEAALAMDRAAISAQRAAFLAARGMDRYAELLLEAVLA